MSPGENKSQIACYIPIDPLDISSDWTCILCRHTIGHAKISELEEVALKIVSPGDFMFQNLTSVFQIVLTESIKNIEILYN